MQRIYACIGKMDTSVNTSWVVAIVLPKLLRQQTSHIQQVHPTSRDLNSFVLPIHKWMPLLPLYEVMPQGRILTRPTGTDFLIQINPTVQHLCKSLNSSFGDGRRKFSLNPVLLYSNPCIISALNIGIGLQFTTISVCIPFKGLSFRVV